MADAAQLPSSCRHTQWCSHNGPCANGNCDARGRPSAPDGTEVAAALRTMENILRFVRLGIVLTTEESIEAGLAMKTLKTFVGGAPKPYAYEFGRSNGDGTYSVVIERGSIVPAGINRYEHAPPRDPHRDHPVKPLYEHPPVVTPRPACPAGFALLPVNPAGAVRERLLRALEDAGRSQWAGTVQGNAGQLYDALVTAAIDMAKPNTPAATQQENSNV